MLLVPERGMPAACLALLLVGCRDARPDARCGVAEPGTPVAVHGDSTAVASRIPYAEKMWNLVPALDGTRWYNQLGRPVFNDGRKGQSIAAMRDRMRRDARHRADTTIIYDRANPGEHADRYLAALADAVGTLETTRFLILPQVPNVRGHEDRVSRTVMPAIDAEVARRWPANTFSADERRAFVAALSKPETRADPIHRNAAGQRIEARFIRCWLGARGW